MERLTPQEAWASVKERQTQPLVGLDENDVKYAFLQGNEVLRFTFCERNREGTLDLGKLLKDGFNDLKDHLAGALAMVIELYSAKDHPLMMDDMNGLNDFMELATNHVEDIRWGLNVAASTDYVLSADVYVVI